MAGVAGLILAGGEGSRFGGPKAWARLPDGRTFLEACAAAFQESGADPVIATLPPGSDDPHLSGLSAVVLPETGLDMFASLRLGIRRLVVAEMWSRLAILPVDHPLVRPSTVVTITENEARAAIPVYRGKHGHPVMIDRSVAEAITAGTMVGPTLREILREAVAVDVRVDDSGTTANCNTPDALERALMRHR